MNGSHKLIEIAFYVSLIVIIALAITFTILFTLYAIYKKKHISYGHEDEKLLEQLKKKYRLKLEMAGDISASCPEKENEQINDGFAHTCIKEEPIIYDGKLLTYVNDDKEKAKQRGKIGRAFSILLYLILFALIGVVASYKINNDHFYIQDTTYMVIQTGSMEEAYEGNLYLKEHDLTNQIAQYSMIGIEKVEAKDIRLYDVIAFKNSSGDTIVHRVIHITFENEKCYFTMRGDSNSGTNYWESAVTEDKIIGRYDGYQNYGLGVAITYFKSTAGIIALTSTTIFLFAFDISESSLEKEYEKRKLALAEAYDNGGN